MTLTREALQRGRDYYAMLFLAVLLLTALQVEMMAAIGAASVELGADAVFNT